MCKGVGGPPDIPRSHRHDDVAFLRQCGEAVHHLIEAGDKLDPVAYLLLDKLGQAIPGDAGIGLSGGGAYTSVRIGTIGQAEKRANSSINWPVRL